MNCDPPLFSLLPSLRQLETAFIASRSHPKGPTEQDVELVHQICAELNCNWDNVVPLIHSYSTVQNFTDRIVFFSNDNLEVRAHVFKAGASETTIHDHQFRFISCCLQGSYIHNLHAVVSNETASSSSSASPLYSQERHSGGRYTEVANLQGNIYKLLSQTLEAGQALYLHPYAKHTIIPSNNDLTPVVTLVFRDKCAVKTSSTIIWDDNQTPPPEQMSSDITNEVEREALLKRFKVALENHQSVAVTKSTVLSFTMPRTELLLRVNKHLHMSGIVRKWSSTHTSRDPVPRKWLRDDILEGLELIGVDPNRISIIKSLPMIDERGADTLICVCRLSECCKDEKDCRFCLATVRLLKQQDGADLNSKVWMTQQSITENSIYHKSTGKKLGNRTSEGRENTTRASVITPCRNGDSCIYYAQGGCRFYHEPNPVRQ